jgi:putative SOS response-associated peptidase YedK
MCNDYRYRAPADRLVDEFAQLKIPLRFPAGVPNLPPRDDIRIGDSAPIVTASAQGADLVAMKWAWSGPGGKPVFNFKSEARDFSRSDRCLIPADGFYEFTDKEPGQTRKTKWLFTLAGRNLFFIAGIVKEGAWAMLTTEPGPDVAPYHNRQIVVLPPERAGAWLFDAAPELLAPLPAGSLTVEKVFPA